MRFILLGLNFLLLSCQNVPVKLYTRSHCKSKDTTFSDGKMNVEVREYVGAAKSDRAIVILPPTGGMTILDRDMADKLCRAGFDVYIQKHWTADADAGVDLGLHQRLYEGAMQALNIILKQTPAKFVGVLGTSVGATYATIAINQIDRLNAAFAIVGGFPLREIIAGSDQSAMKYLRKVRFEEHHFKSEGEYVLALKSAFPFDRAMDTARFHGKSLGMVIALKDTTVPTATQFALQKYWNPQTVYEIDSSHFWGIVKAWWWHKADIVKFFVNASANSK